MELRIHKTIKIAVIGVVAILLCLALGPITKSFAAVPTNGKTYVIHTVLDDGWVLDVQGAGKNDNDRVQIYPKNGTKAQKFKLELYTTDKSGTKWYYITNVNSGKVLDVTFGLARNGQAINQYKKNGTNAQLFTFVGAGGTSYKIVSKLDKNMVVDVPHGWTSWGGQPVWLYTWNGTKAQRWTFELK